jgi:hypothetical protein
MNGRCIRASLACFFLAGRLASGQVLLQSPYRYIPQTLDGRLEWGEWFVADTLDFDHGFIAAAHDSLRLYLLIDVTEDSGEDPCGYGAGKDSFWLTFDTDRDGVIDSGDVNYAMATGSCNLGVARYSGPGLWSSFRTTNVFSARAIGFDCFSADGTYLHYVPPLAPVCKQHRIWEVAIDLAEIGVDVYGGETQRKAKMGPRVASSNPAFTNEAPAGFTTNFSNLIEVRLERPPGDAPVYHGGASFQFDETPYAIEVVQATQNRTNSQRLAQDKVAAARVYLRTVGSETPQPARIYLFGNRGGTNLPGSPLALRYQAPLAVDRERLRGSANFQMPTCWCTGAVNFVATAKWGTTGSGSCNPLSLSFLPCETPVFWVIPVRVLYDGNPVPLSESSIGDKQSYVETVFPVPSIRWVRRPWWILSEYNSPVDPTADLTQEEKTEWGNLQLEILHDLREMYYRREAARASASFSIVPGLYIPFPDQIFGVIPRGGQADASEGNPEAGLSPGCHHVSTIGLTGHADTMAHETVHNLDTNLPFTWGSHLCEGSIPWTWSDCAADGCDPDWSWPDPFVHGAGFDTRWPWADPYDQEMLNIGDRFTVIRGQPELNFTPNPYAGHEGEFLGHTNGFVDFMSYCKSAVWRGEEYNPASVQVKPVRWISTYRWERLFDYYALDGGGGAGLKSGILQTQMVYYCWGEVFADGAAVLDPVFTLPGYASRAPLPGPYSLQVQDTNGLVLSSLSFKVSFLDYSLDDEENREPVPHDSARFHFQIPFKRRGPGLYSRRRHNRW